MNAPRFRLVGMIVSDADYEGLAAKLEPGFNLARWRWFDVGIPTTADIAEAIRDLVKAIEEQGEWRAQTGGLQVDRDRSLPGRFILSADPKLISAEPSIESPAAARATAPEPQNVQQKEGNDEE